MSLIFVPPNSGLLAAVRGNLSGFDLHSLGETLVPPLGLEVHSQWEEEEVDRWGFIFAAGLESMLAVYPNTCGFPGFSWSPLIFLCLLPSCIPLSYKIPKTAVS